MICVGRPEPPGSHVPARGRSFESLHSAVGIMHEPGLTDALSTTEYTADFDA